MSTKAAEKIVEALTQLVEGFAELQEHLESEYGAESDDDETTEEDEETNDLEDALVTEVRAAVESVIENEDCAPEDLASIISALTGALEEVAPEVFSEETEEDEEESQSEEDEDIDLEEDDYDYDEEEDDDDDDDDEEEED